VDEYFSQPKPPETSNQRDEAALHKSVRQKAMPPRDISGASSGLPGGKKITLQWVVREEMRRYEQK
jgi:hypothetical protein